MRGIVLTDEQWSIFKNKLLEAGVYRKKRLHLTVRGILFKLKSGCPLFTRASTCPTRSVEIKRRG